jgi:phosphatidylserine/phosphatidylglycerophosphate/cardiolipin synthase-like enzyme
MSSPTSKRTSEVAPRRRAFLRSRGYTRVVSDGQAPERREGIRRIIASIVGEDTGEAEAEDEHSSLIDTATRALSGRLERWGQGSTLRRLFGGVERDVLTGPGEWVELEAQLGVAAKLGSVARFTIDRNVVAELPIGDRRELRAMVRAPGPGLYELGVELDSPVDELIGHRILQVASGRPLVLIDAALLLPGPDGRPPLLTPEPLIRALLDADLELAYFDSHDENRRVAIHEALHAGRLPLAATLVFAAEDPVERLGLDFAHMFGMTALRRYLARGVPIAAIISERFSGVVEPIRVLRPELALHRASALDFTAEHAAARQFVDSHRTTDPITWRLDQATGTKLVHGNRFHAELDNARARTRLFELIDGAQSSIHLQFYQLRASGFSEQLVVALIRRARAGVHVRLMVDALYSDEGVLGRQNPLLRSLEVEPNIEVLALSPIGSRRDVDVPRLKQRDHRKLAIVDGRQAFVSGRNGADVYYRGFDELSIHDHTPHQRIPWLDAHIEIEGPLVTEVQDAFLATWLEGGGAALPSVDELTPVLPAVGESAGRLVVHRGLADANGLAMYEAMLDVASDHVIIVNDYPIVSTLERAILRLLARGVRVDLLTGNAAARRDDGTMFPAHIHRILFEHMVKARLEPLMLAGVNVYEYTAAPGPNVVARGGRVRPYVHAKIVSTDGKLCSIGSANLDATASFWESEANVVVQDEKFVQGLEAQLRAMIASSLLLDPESEYWKRERAQRAVVGTLWPGSLYS